MLTLVLNRQNGDSYGTFGDLERADGSIICVTCERSDHGDHPCIPAGTYRCSMRWSEKHQRRLYGVAVPGRSDIEIHSANWPSQLLGCIALGEKVELIEGKLGVSDSRNTFDAFMKEMGGVDFMLSVLDTPDIHV